MEIPDDATAAEIILRNDLVVSDRNDPRKLRAYNDRKHRSAEVVGMARSVIRKGESARPHIQPITAHQ